MSKYIDAELLKKVLSPREWGTPDERWIPEHEIGAMLDYFPAADVAEVKYGHWVAYPIADGMNQCSVCGMLRFGESNYCSNCGARMDEIAPYPKSSKELTVTATVSPVNLATIARTVVDDIECDRDICYRNEVNGIGCDECEVMKGEQNG